MPDDENDKYAEWKEQPPGAEQIAADYQQNHSGRRKTDRQAGIADLPESLLGQTFFNGPTLAPRGILAFGIHQPSGTPAFLNTASDASKPRFAASSGGTSFKRPKTSTLRASV